jgi:hypothetical protein
MSNTRLFGVTGEVVLGVLDHSEHNAPLRFGPRHLDQKIVFWLLYENVLGGPHQGEVVCVLRYIRVSVVNLVIGEGSDPNRPLEKVYIK